MAIKWIINIVPTDSPKPEQLVARRKFYDSIINPVLEKYMKEKEGESKVKNKNHILEVTKSK